MRLIEDIVSAVAKDAAYYNPKGIKPGHRMYAFTMFRTVSGGVEELLYDAAENEFKRIEAGAAIVAWLQGEIDTPSTLQAIKHAIPISKRYGPFIGAVYAGEHARDHTTEWSRTVLGYLVWNRPFIWLPWPEKIRDWAF